MPTFTRKVLKVEAEDINDLSSVAKVTHWRVTCDQDQSISAYGTQILSEPNPDDFIDLSIVTETTVISWLGSDIEAKGLSSPLETVPRELITENYCG